VPDSIESWLESLGLGQYAAAFVENDVDLDVLPTLDAADLRELGVSLGHSKKILRAIAHLADATAPAASSLKDRSAERRQLTAVFCDLVDSASLSETLDPEDLRELLDAYYGVCSAVAQRFGGHVARYVGDGVDLYFGYPQAFEKSAVAAVEASLEIAAAVEQLARDLAQADRLSVRIGVHTGLVVVGDVGAGTARSEMAVVGDVPVIASRIQTLASPGTVVVSEATRLLVSSFFELEELGLRTLKGLSRQVRLFVARRVADDRASRGLRSTAGDVAVSAAPLVNRDEETAVLLESWRLATQGSGQTVALRGEPGMGKTRLVQLVVERSAADRPVLLHCQCSPYRGGSALFPVIERLWRDAQLEAADSSSVRLDKLERLLARSFRSVEPAAPYFAALLSIPDEGRYPPLGLTPDELREETFAVLLAQLEGLCRDSPVLLVFEDVHWADPTSLELLGRISARAAGLKLLCLITCRPDFELPRDVESHVTTLTLGRLTDHEASAIVELTAAGKPLPATVAERILERTDGVPLFLEELTRTVLESGALVEQADRYELAGRLGELSVPATLHDSLTTRLDRLGPVKQVAQSAAVIGREFSLDMLSAVSPLGGAELAAALERLTQAGLVIRHQFDAASNQYMFKHGLVQKAAYESVLRRDRRTLHGRIAEALEQRPDVRDTQPEVLARHYEEAERTDQAITYFLMAGERATAGSHYEEALDHFERALDLIRTLPETRSRLEQELDAHTALRNVLVVARGYSSPEVEHACAVSRQLCEELGATEQLFPVLWNLAGLHMVRGEHAASAQINDRLLEIAAASGDPELSLMAHDTVGQTLFYLGALDEAAGHLDEAITLYDPVAHRDVAARYGEEDPGVAAYGYKAFVLWLLGYPERAVECGAMSIRLAESLPHPHSLALAFSVGAQLAYLRRDVDAARSASSAMLRLCEEQRFAYYLPTAKVHYGWVVAHDDPEAGLQLMDDGLRGLERIGARLHHPYTSLLLAEAYLTARREDDANRVLREALALVQRTSERCYESELIRLRGTILQGQARLDDAERCFHDALALAASIGARSLELRAANGLATLWLERGRAEDARTLLGDLCASFTEGFEEADLRTARALLGIGEPGRIRP
jgi:class 3 adenylate cyclase/tetratricopeptide (TPR) repeat protein